MSAFNQSVNTMHSSADYQELAEENKILLVKMKKLNESIKRLENIIQKLMKKPLSYSNRNNNQNSPKVKEADDLDKYRDLIIQTCQ